MKRRQQMDPTAAAFAMAPILRLLLRGGAGGAASWLRENEGLVNGVLDAAMGRTSAPVTKAAISFLQWLGPQVADEPLLLADAQTPTVGSSLSLTQAEPLYEALRIAALISGTEPGRMVEKKTNSFRLLPLERRVAIGVTRHMGADVPLLLLAKANAKAEKLARDADPRIQVRVVGQASNSNSGKINPPTVSAFEHRPGRSVAHYGGTAGSLGAYVAWNDERSGREIRGFMGASHVMSLVGKAELMDYIHSPGVPDEDNNDRFRYGRLADARRLVHVDDAAAADAYVNNCDTAVARLTRKCQPRNEVPGEDPDGPLVPVERVLAESELRAYSGNVFLVGRTTPRSQGRFLGTDITEFLVGMPDGREYLFGQGLAAVESADPHLPFSRGGDSGAIVYGFQAGHCVALGFVIGAADGITYISPAARCLETMKVRLLGH